MQKERVLKLVVPENWEPDADGDSGTVEPLAGYPDVLTPAQVAEILQVSRAHVSDLCVRGVIPSVKVGRRRRIPKHMLIRWLEGEI